jgi:hypothetical protein
MLGPVELLVSGAAIVYDAAAGAYREFLTCLAYLALILLG